MGERSKRSATRATASERLVAGFEKTDIQSLLGRPLDTRAECAQVAHVIIILCNRLKIIVYQSAQPLLLVLVLNTVLV